MTRPVTLLMATAIVLVAIALGVLLRKLVLSPLVRRSKRATYTAKSALLRSLKRYVPIWCGVFGAFGAARLLGVPPRLAAATDRTLVAAAIMAVTLWAADLVAGLLLVGGASGSAVKATSSTGVVRNLARIAVVIVGALVLLGTLGVSVAPVFTTVGLGGLAVSLGLQKTIANLFAGMEITVEGNIRVGDFVKLESGEEGYVEDIHWRTTRVRTLFNISVLIPNSQLADSVVTNYHLPSRSYMLLVEVGVHPASDLEQVEEVTLRVARDVMETVPGGVPDFAPFMRYHTFADSRIEFNVILRVQEFIDNFLVRHEFIKALTRAFAEEGIDIPFPTQVVRLEAERSER